MTETISGTQLQRLSDFVARHFGLHFPRERWPDLQRGVSAAAHESHYQRDLDRYVQELLSPTRRQIESLASYLTVGETYFFREKRSLEVLEKDIVPELILRRTGRAIRIWSAGCATGEEPYSVAIIVSKLLAGHEPFNVEILATDLNAKSLQKASVGMYGEWSFRGTPAWVRSTYFEMTSDDRWAINSAIKDMVTFAQFNLMDDSVPRNSISPNSFDVIFCRNVLMYFTPEGMRKVVQRLYRSLASEGWLIVSPTETSCELFSEFAAVDFGGVTLYRKSPALQRNEFVSSVACGENEFGPSLFEQKREKLEPSKPPSSGKSQPRKDHETHSGNAEEPFTPLGQDLALYDLGRYENTHQTVGTLPSRYGHDAQAMFLVARAYANQGDLAAGLVWCDKAIAADKAAARAYYLRAIILQEQGSLSDAVFALKQTVYLEPQFVLAHFCLGNLALNLGRLKESEKHFENVLLLLAQYESQDVVPESEGISAGRLGEMIVSRRRAMAPIVAEPEVSHRKFRRAGKPPMEQTRGR